MQRYMDARQVARYLRCSLETIGRYRRGTKRFPPLPCVPLGSGTVVFEVEAVRKWAEEFNPKRLRMIEISEARRRALEEERSGCRA